MARPGMLRVAGGIARLLDLHGQGRHLGVERALQIPDLVLQLRYIALQLDNFFAGCRAKDGESEGCGRISRRNFMQGLRNIRVGNSPVAIIEWRAGEYPTLR